MLSECLTVLGLNPAMYGFHSFRVGRTTDLIKYNYDIEEVKRMGRWHSNTVYKYVAIVPVMHNDGINVITGILMNLVTVSQKYNISGVIYHD